MTYPNSYVTVGDDSHTRVMGGTVAGICTYQHLHTRPHTKHAPIKTIATNTPTSEIRTQPERAQPVNTLADKFFTERELIVGIDEENKTVAEAARDWFDKIENTINTLDTFRHDNVGQPLDSTSEYTATATEDADTEDAYTEDADTASGSFAAKRTLASHSIPHYTVVCYTQAMTTC